jgi:SAM-dependent methyltransferase
MAYTFTDPTFLQNLQLAVPLFCLGLFVACLFCHGELYRLKPATAHLTSYYVMISLGGALGAILVGLLAPRVLPYPYEFHITLVATALIAVALLWDRGWLTRGFWMLATAGLAVALGYYVKDRREAMVFMTRSFYGTLTVKDDSDGTRVLRNGTILHGEQFIGPEREMDPTTYYGHESGVGLALDNCCKGPRRVGIIGLGAGTLAAYGKEGDVFRFYDINPQVVDVARKWFTFLSGTPAKTEVVLGDARLNLEREPPQQFDVLVVDAFTGDAIPVHLLTHEAMLVYLRHLKPDGVMAIHTSNTFLELSPVVKQLADSVDCAAVFVNNPDDDPNGIFNSDWVLVTRNEAFLQQEAIAAASESIHVPRSLRLWTDDYNSLFRILKGIRWRPPS